MGKKQMPDALFQNILDRPNTQDDSMHYGANEWRVSKCSIILGVWRGGSLFNKCLIVRITHKA